MNGSPVNDGACPIDHEHLTDMSGGDMQFEAELMQEFLRVTPTLIEELEAGVQAGDTTQVERTAHTLKGSCRSLGARPMSNPCETLERMARTGESGDTKSLVREIHRQYAALVDYISQVWKVRAA